MERHKVLSRLGLAALCLIFAGGLIQLNRISLSSFFPSFSSLRSDEGGTKLLWEGLARAGKVSQRRNYQPLEETRFTGCSVFYLGLRPDSLTSADEAFLRAAERILENGNRLILGLTDDPIDTDEKGKKDPLLAKRWNIRFIQSKNRQNGNTAVSVDARSPWQSVNSGASSVAFERAFGAGTIVLFPHVSRISNAELAKDEESRKLIPLLIGNNQAVVFDETHLGMTESGSIAGLARKYRLQGFLAGLLILVGAFLWSRSVAFPPTQATVGKDKFEPIAGNDTRGTLVNLLSRHIPPQDLLKICVAEWNRIRPDRKIAEDGSVIGKDPVMTYRGIQENLQHEKTWKL